ncbi:GNAT family N-acetyltransferase [Brevundimonas sp.]|uniref:GNAT family N-acetyltransferase n=2 Tax=Brevundimonas sp. TaxID=1871086 RepID=UPI002FCC77A0
MSEVADRLAALHAEAFDAPWDAAAFGSLLGQAGVHLAETPDGFILMRTAADEAEILTLAVRPGARRRGLGAELVARGAAEAAARGATRLFLEVADDNDAARALYAGAGFEEAGRRPRYYARADGSRRDALLLALNLPGRLP